VRQATIAEVEALAARATLVRSPDPRRLVSLLAGEGVEATAVGEDRITAHAPTDRVGEIAAAHGVVLHELTTERASLEEVFLELTGEPGERGG
jgi:ABC-2 type transport system ATP-binding protein